MHVQGAKGLKTDHLHRPSFLYFFRYNVSRISTRIKYIKYIHHIHYLKLDQLHITCPVSQHTSSTHQWVFLEAPTARLTSRSREFHHMVMKLAIDTQTWTFTEQPKKRGNPTLQKNEKTWEPPKGKLGKSSTQKCQFGRGYVSFQRRVIQSSEILPWFWVGIPIVNDIYIYIYSVLDN